MAELKQWNTLQHTATHCNTLQHTTIGFHTLLMCYMAELKRCNTCKLQHTATHCNTLQHTATHCNTLQHTATNYNTLQLDCLRSWRTTWLSHVSLVKICHSSLRLYQRCFAESYVVLYIRTFEETVYKWTDPSFVQNCKALRLEVYSFQNGAWRHHKYVHCDVSNIYFHDAMTCILDLRFELRNGWRLRCRVTKLVEPT